MELAPLDLWSKYTKILKNFKNIFSIFTRASKARVDNLFTYASYIFFRFSLRAALNIITYCFENTILIYNTNFYILYLLILKKLYDELYCLVVHIDEF